MASTTAASNGPQCLSHTVTVSGVVENTATLPPSDNRKYSFRSCTVAITCNGWDGDRPREYDGVLTSHCSALDEPLEGHCYVTKSRFLPDTLSANYAMYHEADHKILVGTSESFARVLHNNTAITGLGLVGSKTTIPDNVTGKETLCFVMKHVDYKPETCGDYSFEIEYWICPTRNLEKSQGLIQLARETLITGFIVDWDEENTRWIVEVTGVSVCSGRVGSNAQSGPSAGPSGGQVTPVGRVRPAKHVPSTTPTKASPAKSTPGGKGKRKAATQEVPLYAEEDEDVDSKDEDLETESPPPPPPKPAKKTPKPRAKKQKPAKQ